jgi:hypothetical protein
MVSEGLSLMAFMCEADAMNHLRKSCVCGDSDLRDAWLASQSLRGAPMERAGNPQILPVPDEHRDYLRRVRAALPDRARRALAHQAGMSDFFKLVEIDPLLCSQCLLEIGRYQRQTRELATSSELRPLLELALPVAEVGEDRCGSSLTRVIQVRERCFLRAGFHRAVGARIAGHTHIPCIFSRLPYYPSLTQPERSWSFSRTILESDDPPTLGHFTHGRACRVQLRAPIRMLRLAAIAAAKAR